MVHPQRLVHRVGVRQAPHGHGLRRLPVVRPETQAARLDRHAGPGVRVADKQDYYRHLSGGTASQRHGPARAPAFFDRHLRRRDDHLVPVGRDRGFRPRTGAGAVHRRNLNRPRDPVLQTRYRVRPDAGRGAHAAGGVPRVRLRGLAPAYAVARGFLALPVQGSLGRVRDDRRLPAHRQAAVARLRSHARRRRRRRERPALLVVRALRPLAPGVRVLRLHADGTAPPARNACDPEGRGQTRRHAVRRRIRTPGAALPTHTVGRYRRLIRIGRRAPAHREALAVPPQDPHVSRRFRRGEGDRAHLAGPGAPAPNATRAHLNDIPGEILEPR